MKGRLSFLITAALLSAGCGGAERTVVAPPVSGLRAALLDEVRDLPRDRIAWTTTWQLCWDRYPGAAGYELQAQTGEGIAGTLIRQRARCFRIETVRGENAKLAGLVDRELLLVLQQGQLAYRVRAVLPGDLVSEWSEFAVVGATRK